MAERSGEFRFSYVDPRFEEFVFAPIYDLTITFHRCRVRRKLIHLTFLIHRPRGRKLLGARVWRQQITVYGVKIDA